MNLGHTHKTRFWYLLGVFSKFSYEHPPSLLQESTSRVQVSTYRTLCAVQPPQLSFAVNKSQAQPHLSLRMSMQRYTLIYTTDGRLSSLQSNYTNLGRDQFNQNSDRSAREKRTTSKGGPVFSKLFRLDRTDPLRFGRSPYGFGPKFPEIFVEWIAPLVMEGPVYFRTSSYLGIYLGMIWIIS